MKTNETEIRVIIYRNGSKITIKSKSPIFRGVIKAKIGFLAVNFDVATIDFHVDEIVLVIKDTDVNKIADKLNKFTEDIERHVKQFKEWRDQEVSKQ